MRSLKPICVRCARFYRVKQNGVYFREGMPISHPADYRVEPGYENDEQWEDYKLWSGDLWECQGCGHLLIEGVGAKPLSEHYQPAFADWCKRMDATFRVNDC